MQKLLQQKQRNFRSKPMNKETKPKEVSQSEIMAKRMFYPNNNYSKDLNNKIM